MSEPFIGEIKIVSFNFAPKNWAFCNGQILSIQQNQALFSILGTYYGGNGITTFALPNLQGCMPIHVGQVFSLGQTGGESAHTLNIQEMPVHMHTVAGSSSVANQSSPVGNFPAASAANPYSTSINGVMNSATVSQVGNSQAHENMPPFLVLNFIIALYGIYPSRN